MLNLGLQGCSGIGMCESKRLQQWGANYSGRSLDGVLVTDRWPLFTLGAWRVRGSSRLACTIQVSHFHALIWLAYSDTAVFFYLFFFILAGGFSAWYAYAALLWRNNIYAQKYGRIWHLPTVIFIINELWLLHVFNEWQNMLSCPPVWPRSARLISRHWQ